MAARDDVSSSSSEVKREEEHAHHIGTLLKEAPRKGLVQLKNSFRSLSASPKRLTATTAAERGEYNLAIGILC